MTNSIADMFTRIRNAYLAKHETVDIPFSVMKQKIAEILEKEKYIKSIEVKKGDVRSQLHLTLNYVNKLPAVDGIEMISKPGRRMYSRVNKIPRVLGGQGICILSTSKGILTDKQARQAKIGGEILCRVW